MPGFAGPSTNRASTGAPVITADGKRRKAHVFRIVLSHSRKGYSEAVFRQTTENFIRALENAFWHFGGIPKTLVIDNLRAAVTKAVVTSLILILVLDYFVTKALM